MPTPVGVARQCLSEEAARALDDAVAVARRRSHIQTTSLHAVSALLALPSSTLREACARARNSSCSSRLQFRALELCVGVSLDRLPSSKSLDEPPPVSNSLMAAIKRGQAYQRRHVDNFRLMQIHYNQQTASVLKVELEHFILAILDDPIVNRVLGDAGFRNCDVKLAILHPPLPQVPKFSSTRCPPLFLCNLMDSDPSGPGFSFPFSGIEGGDENSRRIGEALAKRKDKAKTLLLLGVCGNDALSKFVDCVDRDEAGVLPSEIAGLKVISIEKEISEFIAEGGNDREKMDLKFDELRDKLEQCSGPGIVLNMGEIKVLVDENASLDAVSFLISKLTALMESFREKMRLIGVAARYETYTKFLGQFPDIEKEWDLHLLPITSKSSTDGFGPKSGLMGSFVPLGGFFSLPCDTKNSLSTTNQPVTRCHLCNAKYEQEVSAMLKTEPTVSVSDRYSEMLPLWLQTAQLDKGLPSSEAKTKNDGTVFNAKLLGLQKKWNDICQQLHQPHPLSRVAVSPHKSDTSYAESPKLPISFHPGSERVSFQSKQVKDAFENSQIGKDTPSLSSVTTDLGLSIPYAASSSHLPSAPQLYNNGKQHQHSNPSSGELFHSRDYKSISKALTDKVGWQEEAISCITQAISRCRAGCGRIRGSTARGDIWLAFIGPDKVGKQKIASALSETIFSRQENLVSVDLSCHQVESRGKTLVDVIAMALRKNPSSVVLLENVDKCEDQTRASLLQAVMTGRFTDSYRNEIRVNNMVFLMTLTSAAGNMNLKLQSNAVRFSEERILGAKTQQMQILIEPAITSNKSPSMNKRKLGLLDLNFEANKRAHRALGSSIDLNLPVEDSDENTHSDSYDSDSISENSGAWLEDLLDKVDEKVTFKPFDFDGLAEKITREIDKQFEKVFGSGISLAIDEEVMVQILSASWLSERRNAVEEWVETVLTRAFSVARQKYGYNVENAVRLTSYEGVPMEEQVPGLCLPCKISV